MSTNSRRRKLALTLAVALSGGSVMSTCQTRLKNTVMDNLRGFVIGQLSVETLLGPLLDEESEE